MGARLVRDLNPAGSSSPESIISIDGILYFTADLGPSSLPEPPLNDEGSEQGEDTNTENNIDSLQDNSLGQGIALLKSDGTAEGTKVLKEFTTIDDLVEVNGELYFIADDGTGNRLWRSDGTARGTILVKDLYPGADPNFSQDLFEIDGVLFYSAIDGSGDDGKYPYVKGYEVWRREGSEIGSRFFRNLMPDKTITNIDSSSEETESIALDENGEPIELIKETTVITEIGLGGITTITTTVAEETYINGQVVTSITTGTEQRETDPKDLTTTSTLETIEDYICTDSDGNVTGQLKLYTTTTTTKEIDTQNRLITTTTVTSKEYANVIDCEKDDPITTTSTTEEAITGGDLESRTVQEEKSYATETVISSTAGITTTTNEIDSFPRNFVGINGNYFFTAQSSAFYSLETQTSDTLIGGLELWFSDGTEAGTRPININQNNYTFYDPEDGNYIPAEIVDEQGFGFKQQSSSSFPRELTNFKDDLVLVANDGLSGFELWTVTDQGEDPRQIADISTGNTSSSPEELTVVGNHLYFTANDGTGRKLWSTTQDFGVPTLVNGAGTDPRQLTAIDDQLYFSARSELGRELWVADGESAKLVEDINPGSGSSSPANFTALEKRNNGNTNKQLFFTADGGERGIELWSLNLSSSSSQPERYDDIVDGPTSSEPRQLVNAEQRLFFTADDGKSGRELWTLGVTIVGPDGSTNGGSSAVIQVEEETKNVFQFSSQSDVNWSLNGGDDADQFNIKKNGWLQFQNPPALENPVDLDKDNIYQVRIRATDQLIGSSSDQLLNVQIIDITDGGKLSSVTLVKDIRKGERGSDPNSIIFTDGGMMLFSADNGKKGIELWQSLGSKKTTSLLKDINPGPASSTPSGFAKFGNKLYFAADDGSTGRELWRTNGTSKGTKQVIDLRPGVFSSSPTDLAVLDNSLLFGANDGTNGSELWGLSKGTTKPKLIRDINPNIGSQPKELTIYQKRIYFSAEGPIYGRELWETDGTKDGTKLTLDINPGGFHSNPQDLTIFGERLYFTAETYTGGRQLWSTNGTSGGTQKMSPLVTQDIYSNVEELTATGEQLFFSAESQLIRRSNEAENQDLGRELWSMKGNLDSIQLVLDINPGPEGSNPTDLVSIDNLIYFSADNGKHGEELWMSDGTSEGTIRLTDINTGSKNSSPREITKGNDGIYFSALEDSVGRELWRLEEDNQSATRIVTAGKGKKKHKALDDSKDEFRFELADQFGKAKADRITGFRPNDGDQLALSTDAFPGLSEINLVTVSSKRQLKAQRNESSNLIYYEAKGKLYFDQNGDQAGFGEHGGMFAILRGEPDLAESAFRIL